MKTFSSVERYFSVVSDGGFSVGALYASRDKAERIAAALTREWQGARSFTVRHETVETFTAFQA